MSLTDNSKENQLNEPKNSKIVTSRNALKSINLSTLLNAPQTAQAVQPSNPQLLVDYASEIFVNLHKQEPTGTASNEYMKLQPEINQKLRAVLID